MCIGCPSSKSEGEVEGHGSSPQPANSGCVGEPRGIFTLISFRWKMVPPTNPSNPVQTGGRRILLTNERMRFVSLAQCASTGTQCLPQLRAGSRV
jgi:hypothetical protein